MLNTKPYTSKLQNKMKATSKFIMAATLVMVVTLAIVLGLILVLLAELYCSLLLHRRHLRKKPISNTTIPTSATPPTTTISKPPPLLTPHSPPSPPSPPPPPFASAYSQGVLQAPRSFLFPCKDEQNPTPRGIGLVSLSSPSPLASFLARAPPPQSLQPAADEKPCGGGVEHLVYISNPIYENELEAKASRVNTPFETPNTSPSRLSGSSGEDDDRNGGGSCGCSHSPPSLTPPLTPMKKLPAEGSSVSLRDATSLGTSGSDTHSINGPSSSSSSDTPSTSPSW
ncbi:putative proline-rich receptor-like protein kinase PERK11 [Vigna radiata var. radiata]|uniref:Proline-rich receptor-like protein kinase PERK11 n=1 Tax=Vigna radiata var. radiata TaxID=3916 RepID=A0A1S3USG7_VIGRR|nr:putative proline-rich receptor-like protein kinase PERK11 [Vigna radiata var. radiata]